MTKFVASIDQGTTSTRFIVFDKFGHVVATNQKEHRQYYPSPGLVEHDAEEILSNTYEVIQVAMRNSGLSNSDISSLGITNQRETSVLWNRSTGKPYGNAIVWQDTRTQDICRELENKGLSELFRKKSGLPLATYFSGPKIKWILSSNPDLKSDITKGKVLFGNTDSWLIWNLTGGVQGGMHVTDVTNASRTLLMNLDTLAWDSELIRELDIPPEILPRILPSSSFFGVCKNGLPGVPISGDLGDQQAALVGQCCFQEGDVKNTYGTGCFLLMNTGTTPVFSQNGLITTVGYQFSDQKPHYCLEGSVAIAGALVQWLRDNLQIVEKASDIEPLARTVPDSGDVYFVPAFSGLFAPYWRADARGVIVGLTRYANKGHLARACLEATAYQTREVIEAMQMDSGKKLTKLKVDGGMVINELLMQFQSDLLSVPVVRPSVTETTALGAAYAAGLSSGYWKSIEDLQSNWLSDKTWLPSKDKEKFDILFLRWKQAVERSLNWV